MLDFVYKWMQACVYIINIILGAYDYIIEWYWMYIRICDRRMRILPTWIGLRKHCWAWQQMMLWGSLPIQPYNLESAQPSQTSQTCCFIWPRGWTAELACHRCLLPPAELHYLHLTVAISCHYHTASAESKNSERKTCGKKCRFWMDQVGWSSCSIGVFDRVTNIILEAFKCMS